MTLSIYCSMKSASHNKTKNINNMSVADGGTNGTALRFVNRSRGQTKSSDEKRQLSPARVQHMYVLI
jgi:hypothetical protein